MDRYGHWMGPNLNRVTGHMDREASLTRVKIKPEPNPRLRNRPKKRKKKSLPSKRAHPLTAGVAGCKRKCASCFTPEAKSVSRNTLCYRRSDSTSAKAFLEKVLMDWAVVELTDESPKSSKPNELIRVPAEHRPEEYGPSLGSLLPEGRPLIGLGPLEKGGYYLNLGRSTGVTGDIFHGALACCQWI